MKDRKKSKEQLVAELRKLRRRFSALEASQTGPKRTAKALEKERQLLVELLNLQERERQLVAYEIHDGLAQQLGGALLQLQAFTHQCDERPDEARKTIDRAIQLLNDATNEVRRLIRGLRPPVLDELGIVAAIACLVCEAEERGGPQIEFIHSLQADRLPPSVEISIFRVVQESLTNACQHSRSKKVRVKLLGENGNVRVEVRDWGIGFDPEQVEENRFGLMGKWTNSGWSSQGLMTCLLNRFVSAAQYIIRQRQVEQTLALPALPNGYADNPTSRRKSTPEMVRNLPMVLIREAVSVRNGNADE